MTPFEQLAQERALEMIRHARMPRRYSRNWPKGIRTRHLGYAQRELTESIRIRERLARGEKP